jgi:hypothetical protein
LLSLLEIRFNIIATSHLDLWRGLILQIFRPKLRMNPLISLPVFCLSYIHIGCMPNCGHAIAQVLTRRLPTAEAQVRAHVRTCGICDGQRDAGTGFLRVLRFPLPIFNPPTAPHSSSLIRSWYNRPISGRRTKWTASPHSKKLKKKKLLCPISRPRLPSIYSAETQRKIPLAYKTFICHIFDTNL